jgi:hypothetical protein
MTSVLVYGGAALVDVPEGVADRSIELALEAGINHFDTAAAYGDSELHLGRWMSRIRDRIFLATKTGDRTASGAYDSIRRSLERLQVSHVDLIQLHAIGDLEDLGTATGPGGAVEGRQGEGRGSRRRVGITGHRHGRARTWRPSGGSVRLGDRTVQLPPGAGATLSAGLRGARGAGRAQTSGCGSSSPSRATCGTSVGASYTTWYEPMDAQREVTAAVAFVLALPEVAGVCTAGDVRLLPLFIQAERQMRALTSEHIRSVLSEVTDYEPPFVRVEGREIPDWLEPLIPGGPAR